MKNRSVFKMPNALILDHTLSFSARKVGAVLYAFSNALGTCRKSYSQIARLAGCSEATAVAAVRQLASAGYLSFCNTSRWCRVIAGVGKGKNFYSVALNRLQEGYTLVSRDVFRCLMTDAAFVIYMAVLVEAGNATRAWPSISVLQKKTGAARSTVLAGLKLLKKLPMLLVRLCVRRNGAFSANSYISCQVTSGGVKQAVPFAPQPLPSYLKAKRAVCKGVKRIFSFFFPKGVGRNLVIYSYNLDNDKTYKRKRMLCLYRKYTLCRRKDRRHEKKIAQKRAEGPAGAGEPLPRSDV